MSSTLDDIAPAFRAAKERWPNAPTLQSHYDSLRRTFESNGEGIIELCKSFLEMVCITVLKELGAPMPSAYPSTTEYLVATLEKLGLKNTRGSSAFDKVISAHNRLADALTTVRNQEGSVAHGKDGFLDTISDRHARIYLLSTDTVLSLILTVYEGVEPSILHTREPHSRYTHHNIKIDENTLVDTEIDEDSALVLRFRAGNLSEGFTLRVTASELLYSLDRQAYMELLEALQSVSAAETEEGIVEAAVSDLEGVETKVTAEKEISKKVEDTSLKPVADYKGKYANQVNPLYEYIISTPLNGDDKNAKQVLSFTYTLLNNMDKLDYVDWYQRESTRAKVRLLLKKLITRFAIPGLNLSATEEIIHWLAARIKGGNS